MNNITEIKNDYKFLLRATTTSSKENSLILRRVFDLFSRHYFNEHISESSQVYRIAIETAMIVLTEFGLKGEAIWMAVLWYPYFKDKKFAEDCRNSLPENARLWLKDAVKLEEIDTSKLIFQPDAYLKLSLAMLPDIRLLLIKIAEQLALLRNAEFDSEEKQIIASSAYHIYAPILHQLGLYSLNHEMLDRAFSILYPYDFQYISEKLEKTAVKRSEYIEQFCEPLKAALTQAGFSYTLKWRTKSVHSIWRKMKTQNVDFEQVFDLFAIRIVLNVEKSKEKEACWLAYSIVTSLYEPNPSRLRDWITMPKSSGYESLHTTVSGPENQWVEVQIRSTRMDIIAEKGLAAHWKYKGLKTEKSYEEWLNSLREILENPQRNLADALAGINKAVKTEDVYVFTPKSELKKMKAGATVLDFAFELHSEIGLRCTGARVNNKLVPMKYVLQNGDRIEILTSRNQKPAKDWLNIVTTNKAKAKIKRWLTEEQYSYAHIGKETLKRKLKNWKINFNESLISSIIGHFKLNTSLELYSGIANESIDIQQIKDFLTSDKKEQTGKTQVVKSEKESHSVQPDIIIVDPSLKNTDYRFGKCCHPIPGDEIFGFITIDKGITIHHTNCPNARFLLANYPYRKIEAQWSSNIQSSFFEVNILIKGSDEIGMVNKITHVISKEFSVNIMSINIETWQKNFSGIFKLQIRHLEQLNRLIKRLRGIKGIVSIERIDQ